MDGNFDAWTNFNWFEVWAVLEAGTEHNLNDIDKNIVTIIKDTKIDPTKRWNFFEDEVIKHGKTSRQNNLVGKRYLCFSLTL